MITKGPFIPLPDVPARAKCICGSDHLYKDCCSPKLTRLNRTTGYLEKWRELNDYSDVFQVYSDLLWEEQYREEEQGDMAQEYEEWDEWASYLWMEGIILDGFTLGNLPPIPELLLNSIQNGEKIPGGRKTLQALLRSFEGIFEIEYLSPSGEPGLCELRLPPTMDVSIRLPRIFLPSDTEPTDIVICRFVKIDNFTYPTHRPLVIPILSDGSNYDAAYRILAPMFPADFENRAASDMMVRLLKVRGDLLLRAALEALLPLDDQEIRSGSLPMVADGGEIRYMVSDFEAVESNLDHSPFFEPMNPLSSSSSEIKDEINDLLERDDLPLDPNGPSWNLILTSDARKRLKPAERRDIEELLLALAQRVRPPFGIDPMEHWAENPGLVAILDRETGILTARAFLAQPLELGKYLLEREVGSFLARESEDYLNSS